MGDLNLKGPTKDMAQLIVNSC